jgi:RIC1
MQASSPRSPRAASEPPHAYCLLPVPQSQPVLPCLLRRLLLQGDVRGARVLAQHHQHGPHFPRSLEWLLFTSLDHDFGAARSTSGSVDTPDATRLMVAQQQDDERRASALEARTSGKEHPTLPYGRDAWQASTESGLGGRESSGASAHAPLLRGVSDPLRRFPQWRDVVVNVSRKTDATMWPLLFAVVGPPSRLLEQLLRAGAVRSGSWACDAPAFARTRGALHAF